MPGWNEPVATGTRSPIFSEAFWPSEARISGCWISLLLLSVIRKLAVADGMVTSKLVAFKCPRLLRLIWPAVEEDDVTVAVLPEPVVADVLELVALLSCKFTLTLAGGLMPRLRSLSRVTCMMAISTTTSGFDLS